MNKRERKTWRQQWEDYAQVSRIGERSRKYQAAALRGCIEPTGLEVYSRLPFVGAGDRDDTVKILELLEGYYVGKTNVKYGAAHEKRYLMALGTVLRKRVSKFGEDVKIMLTRCYRNNRNSVINQDISKRFSMAYF